MKTILGFLSELKSNNNREWFAAHRDEYLAVKEKIDNLAAGLMAGMAAFEPEVSYLTPSGCTYRIYRDVRFSTDKTPYKTHVGIFINPPLGKKSERLGYYLHIEPGNCFAAVGTISLPPKTVAAIRRSIYDNVEEYLSIIGSPVFRESFPVVGENRLKTVPKGIPRDWEHLDLVRPKDYVATCRISDEAVCHPGASERIVELFRIAKPFRDFINYAIDEQGG